MAKEKKDTTTELVTTDYLAARLDRPTAWVEARLSECEAIPAMKLNGVDYFIAEYVELIREVSLEWAERVRKAKREAVALGE